MARIGVVLHQTPMQLHRAHAWRQQPGMQGYGQHDPLPESAIGRYEHRALRQSALLLNLRNMLVCQPQPIDLKRRRLSCACSLMLLHADASFSGITRHGMNVQRVIPGQQSGLQQWAQQPDCPRWIATGIADPSRSGDALGLLRIHLCETIGPVWLGAVRRTRVDHPNGGVFDGRYGDSVRVLSMGDFSVELCGGIHANRTGDIGLMKIISEGGVASGVRRIEAVTGAAALAYLNAAEEQLKEAATLIKGSRDNLIDKLSAVLERNRLLEKQLEQLQAKAASAAGDDLSAQAVDVKGVKVLAVRLDGQDGKALLALVDQLKNKLGRAVILLGSVHEEKVVLVAGVTKDLTGQLKAGDLMKQAAAAVGGKGGGRPDMAQGGGTDVGALDAALAQTVAFVEQGI